MLFFFYVWTRRQSLAGCVFETRVAQSFSEFWVVTARVVQLTAGLTVSLTVGVHAFKKPGKYNRFSNLNIDGPDSHTERQNQRSTARPSLKSRLS
jgi:hypothetical protein